MCYLCLLHSNPASRQNHSQSIPERYFDEDDIDHIVQIFKSQDASLHEVVWKQSDSIELLHQKIKSMTKENKDLRNQNQEIKSQLNDIQFLLRQVLQRQELLIDQQVSATNIPVPLSRELQARSTSNSKLNHGLEIQTNPSSY